MIVRWIQKKGHDSLLIFFNGWGMDSRIADYLQYRTPASFSRDVLLCYDYRSPVLPADVRAHIARYRDRNLVAWSLGVWAAHKSGLEGIERALAINGTLNPVSSDEGIPPDIFRATLDNYNEENKNRFMRRMCGSTPLFRRFLGVAPERCAPDQKEELASILQDVSREKAAVVSSWSYTHALVGGRDMIFPAKNQEYAWRNLGPLVVDEVPHFPFFTFSNWQEVCSCMEE